MKNDVKSRLEIFRKNFTQVKGRPFDHFYCPILFKDEDVELCRAHIINSAIPNSSRLWTVQRRDVDNFYGAKFEPDLIDIHYAQGEYAGRAITDKKLTKRLSPRILLNDKSVEYFFINTKSDLPEDFTPITFEDDDQEIQLGLKMSPKDVFNALDDKWEIAVAKDVRVSALVSLIKAAHLTLFHMLGYNYALSAGGYFVGRHILGEFFSQNQSKSKAEVLDSALIYFREFASMVRPIQVNTLELKGTIDDGFVHVCMGDRNSAWAVIVYIRLSGMMNAVIIPLFENPDIVQKFMSFLKSSDELIKVQLCQFNQDHWDINNETSTMIWPKTGLLYPEPGEEREEDLD